MENDEIFEQGKAKLEELIKSKPLNVYEKAKKELEQIGKKETDFPYIRHAINYLPRSDEIAINLRIKRASTEEVKELVAYILGLSMLLSGQIVETKSEE